jgi:Tfp pilus assembly protein PilP
VLPAGVAGVEVATLKLDGVVKSPGGMVAVISTPQGRVYFVREGQRLYDGVVERISLDGIVLRERGQDAFGKPIERMVSKRL